MSTESAVEPEWCCAWHRYFAEHAEEMLDATAKLIDSTTWHGMPVPVPVTSEREETK